MMDTKRRKIQLLALPLAHLRRKKGRTSFLFMAVVTAIASLVAVTAAAQSTELFLGKKLDEFGANLVVQPKISELPLDYGGITVSGIGSPLSDLTEEDADTIWTIRNKQDLNMIAPKLIAAANIDNQTLTLVGANLADELRLRPWWHLEGTAPAQPHQVILGANVARVLSKTPEDTIRINGKSFQVTAVLQAMGSAEDNITYADLHEVQALTGKPNKLSVIEVSAWCTNCPIETIEEQIAAKLPNANVSAVKQAISGRRATISTISGLSTVLSILVLAIAVLLLSTSMMSSVSERAREIGVLRAIGFRRTRIMRLILTEAQIICIPAGVAGFTLGTLFARELISRVLDFQAYVAWNPVLALESIILAIFIGGAAAIYPAWRAAGLDPASALRSL